MIRGMWHWGGTYRVLTNQMPCQEAAMRTSHHKDTPPVRLSTGHHLSSSILWGGRAEMV